MEKEKVTEAKASVEKEKEKVTAEKEKAHATFAISQVTRHMIAGSDGMQQL